MSNNDVPGASPIIETRSVSRVFSIGSQSVHAVRDVNLKISRGRFITLVGRSGSGKTTLLNLMAGLDSPTSGAVMFDGRDLATFRERDVNELRRRRLGIVFQSFALLPLLSAYENVELPLRISGVGSGERMRRAREVLGIVGLERRAGHRPYELSGGEQQRVSIARAIAMRPDVLLADEPTGELDSGNAAAIFGLFRKMVDSERMTVVATTHDQTLLDLADDIYRFHDGSLALTAEGRYEPAAHQPSELYREPSPPVQSAGPAQPAGLAAPDTTLVRDEDAHPEGERAPLEEEAKGQERGDLQEVDHSLFMRPKRLNDPREGE